MTDKVPHPRGAPPAGPTDMTDPGWDPAALSANADDAEAMHRLAVITGMGRGVPHDPKLAMSYLGRAADLGHTVANRTRAILEAEPGGLDAWLRPAPARLVSERPRILSADRFVSDAVCDWLVECARGGDLKPARVYNEATGGSHVNPIRTNSAFFFNLARTDLVVVLVREKLAQLAGLPTSGLEASQVLHYLPGQQFDWHVDYLHPDAPGHRLDLGSRGQRIATALIRLNDDYEGGETVFKAGDQRFRGPKGSVVMWTNVTPDGLPDPESRHAGLPPTSGEKWVLSQWMRPHAPLWS